LLEVLIWAAIEHAEGKARAAFYLSDAAELELHHIVGMPPEYARCVNGFAISEQSLACGLAVATRRPIITSDVSGEPRWKGWLWLAKEFGYRACWSFPVATSSGRVLGSFAMYYAEPREATPHDVDLASFLTRTAAMIISRQLMIDMQAAFTFLHRSSCPHSTADDSAAKQVMLERFLLVLRRSVNAAG
jgi:GAF domain-containing protein